MKRGMEASRDKDNDSERERKRKRDREKERGRKRVRARGGTERNYKIEFTSCNYVQSLIKYFNASASAQPSSYIIFH